MVKYTRLPVFASSAAFPCVTRRYMRILCRWFSLRILCRSSGENTAFLGTFSRSAGICSALSFSRLLRCFLRAGDAVPDLLQTLTRFRIFCGSGAGFLIFADSRQVQKTSECFPIADPLRGSCVHSGAYTAQKKRRGAAAPVIRLHFRICFNFFYPFCY